jgi:hypothetical protein
MCVMSYMTHTTSDQSGRFHVSLIASLISSVSLEACSQYQCVNTIGLFRTSLKIPRRKASAGPSYTWNISVLRSQIANTGATASCYDNHLRDRGAYVYAASNFEQTLVLAPRDTMSSTRNKDVETIRVIVERSQAPSVHGANQFPSSKFILTARQSRAGRPTISQDVCH